MQIKKKLVFLLILITVAIFCYCSPVEAAGLEKLAKSDVAGQESVIDEQKCQSFQNLYAGVTWLFVDEDIETIEEEEIPLSPYVDLIDNLTEDETDMLLRIVYAESANQSIEGQRAVIEVIFNRILSENYPDSLEKVLSQKNQFATWWCHNTGTYTETQEEALELVYSESPILSSTNYVFFSQNQFSYATDYVLIGGHWFGALTNN